MPDVKKAYYKKLKSLPCIVCGKFGVDVAHVVPLSKMLGPKREWTARSHKGPRGFFAVPLCREHHQELHAHFSEHRFFDEYGVGYDYIYAFALRTLAEVVDENCDAGS